MKFTILIDPSWVIITFDLPGMHMSREEVFKEIMHLIFCMTFKSKPSTRILAPAVMKFTILVYPHLVIIAKYSLCLIYV